ncbi:MAG: hypothetical protein B6244_09905 [Candidatus Cloacimonetes bacterium 4572_55]|nr:MAG: hypothetical protein B6244_09905 [Candidatus Cloacimonetes bacterium 4572_55]
MIFNLIEIMLGLVALYFGSKYLVQGSSNVAKAFGVRQIIIGLTFVAFGTSSPELAVSLLAAIQNHPDICMGNIVGSNIANIALILGVAVMIKPNNIDLRVIKFDMPLVVFVSLILWLISLDGEITRTDGIVFVLSLGVYLVHAFRSGQEPVDEAAQSTSPSKIKNITMALIGLLILIGGGQFLVHGATQVAKVFGVPELIVGLTIVAFGTSLPELATAIYASTKNKESISIGNIVGSNLFNILFVVGIVSIITPVPVDERTIYWDMPIMLILTIFTYSLMCWKPVVGRISGTILFLFYLGYILQMFLSPF